MKHIKIFENFDTIDYESYCEDFWGVNVEYLFEVINNELDDNGLKTIGMVMDRYRHVDNDGIMGSPRYRDVSHNSMNILYYNGVKFETQYVNNESFDKFFKSLNKKS